MTFIKQTTLDNGLRVAVEPTRDCDTVMLGLWCRVGSRYEDEKDNGLAHIYEPMVFKR
jgi:predicted Zn-dependent peptidase